MNDRKNEVRIWLLMLGAVAAAGAITAQSAAQDVTTYQGQLKSDGRPVTGPVDILVDLIDDLGTGLDARSFLGVDVTNGLFELELDFAPSVYDGGARWLRMNVRSPAGSGDYTELFPAQLISAAPRSHNTRGLHVDDAGNVGIGTTTPGEKLSVEGDIGLGRSGARRIVVEDEPTNSAHGKSLTIQAGSAVSGSFAKKGGDLILQAGNGFNISVPGVDGGDVVIRSGANITNGADNGGDIVFETGGASQAFNEAMRIREGGRVGIGTVSPATALDVNGTVTANAFAGDGSGLTNLSASSLWSANGAHVFFNSGNVGIGTNLPGKRLDVRGDFGAMRLRANSANASSFLEMNNSTSSIRGLFGVDGIGFSGASDQFSIATWTHHPLAFYTNQARRMTIDGSGSVGIGTASPLGGLHVNREPPFPGGTLALEGVTHTYLSFFPQGNAAGRKGWIGYGDANTDHLTVTNEAEGNLNLITPGNVGIGTVNPQDTLDVAGIIRAEGVRLMGGADIAEPFDVQSGMTIRPGMVVAINAAKPGALRLSDRTYDATVAGIISGANGINPGMTLAQEGTIADGEYPVALSGRVWCLVDADANGSIAPGDMLTTSATVGHAMKVDDRSRAIGATVGKAMTPLRSGKGLVLVLVNLQ